MIKTCLHCELPAKKNQDFCCPGCRVAYKTIHSLGMQSYYQNRILVNDEISLKPQINLSKSESDITDFLHKNEDNSFSAYFFVKGLHCGACIWLIENILKRQSNVKIARINMSNKRLHLSWVGDKTYGNKLVQIINNLGYRLIPYDYCELKNEEKKYSNDLLKALCIAGFGAGNVMLMSVAIWSSSQDKMGLATHNFLYWLSALIALPVIIYSGRIFFKSALKSLKFGFGNMDVAISVAIIITTIVSVFEVANKAQHAYFDSALMLLFFLLIGRYLDFLTRNKALSIAYDFSLLNAISAVIIDKYGKNKVILAKNIKKNMILNVAVGDKIAADGVVISGKSEVDASLITGESLPQKIAKNAKVFAGMINLDRPVKVKVTQNQNNSLIAKISNLVANLEKQKGKFVKIADQISKYYTPIVHILALLTFIGWYFYFQSPFKVSLINAVAVLIITCPCALALAVPIVSVLANSKLLKQGIIIKSGEALEKLNKVDTIICDKTGTLTHGKPILKSAKLIDGSKEKTLSKNHQLFILAASMSALSNHPLSKSLSNSFKGELVDLKIKEVAGNGLKSKFKGKEIKLGKKEFVLNKNEENLVKPNNNSQIFIKFGKEIAVFSFLDSLKIDAKEMINELKFLGKEVILLSGDKKEVVTDISKKLKIKEFYYDKDPIQKAKIIEVLKAQNKNIMMVGDGINDAPVLIASDIGVSFALASDIAKNCADIIIQGNKLEPLLKILTISKKSHRLIKENFALSFAYNIIAVPFAVLGYVTPLIAALSMSFSSILVTLNSLRVRR